MASPNVFDWTAVRLQNYLVTRGRIGLGTRLANCSLLVYQGALRHARAQGSSSRTKLRYACL